MKIFYHFYPMIEERNKPGLKLLLLPLILLLLAAALILTWLILPNLLINQLRSHTSIQSDGKYELTIGDIHQSLFPLSISFRKVRLEPVVLNLSDQELPADDILYSFGAEEIDVKGISLRQLITDKIFASNKIKVTKPEISLSGEELLHVDSLKISGGFYKKMWPLFGYVKTVDVNKIEFEEANFSFYSAPGDTNFLSRAKNVSVDVYGFYTSADMLRTGNKYFYTDDILVRINDFQNDMGDSLHVLSIDTLYYSLKTTDITVKGFHLRPWTFIQKENLFDVQVPEVYVKSRSITHFALSDSLRIGYLEFSSPSIRFYQKNQPRKIEIEDLHNFDLYSLVKSQFIKLQVDSFYLRNANVAIFRQPDTSSYRQHFNSINVALHGFELDSGSYLNKEKLMHSDGLEMQVKGYHLKMKDGVHHFRAGSLFVSTFSKRLSAGDINIRPGTGQNPGIRNEINIECRSVNIEDVNFLELYHQRRLPTSKIEVTEPEVHLLYRLEQEKQKKQSGEGLFFTMITDYLEGVYAREVHVAEGKIDISNSLKGIEKGYFETGFVFSLSEFQLDSTNLQNKGNFFYASGFDLLFTDYNMRLVDDIHKLEVDTVAISSRQNQIEFQNLRMQPVKDNFNREELIATGNSELFDIAVPEIRLRGVDLKNAFSNQHVNIKDFSIIKPQIHFENFAGLNPGNENKELTDFYKLLFNYIPEIEVANFSISGGLLTWINHTRKGRTTSFDNEFSASLQNFRLNEKELDKKRLLFSDNFDLTIKDQEFVLSDKVHVLKGHEIRFSSSQSMIRVKDALLYPLLTSTQYNELATTWQIAIPEINIEGFDYQKAWNSQEPAIKRLEVVSPRFQVYTLPGKTKGLDFKAYTIPMPAFIESLSISELEINDATAVIYKKEGAKHSPGANFSFSLKVPGLMVESNEKDQVRITSSNILFAINDFSFPVNGVHTLQAASIDFNRNKKRIEVQNLNFHPVQASHNKNLFKVDVPFISLQDFDFYKALDDNDFKFSNILIKDPELAININDEIINDSSQFMQSFDLYPHVEHLVNSVQVDKLEVSNAFLNFNRHNKKLFNNLLNLSFEGIFIGANSSHRNLLNSKDYTISTTNLSANSNNGLYAYTADTFLYQSAGHKVSLKNICITPVAGREAFPLKDGLQTDVADAKISFVEFEEINEQRWLNENILEAKSLIIGPANIDIFRNKRFPFNSSQRPDWPQDLIKKIKQPFVFDSVKLMPSKIKYSELLSIFNEPGYIEFNNFSFTGSRLSNIPEIFARQHFIVDAQARVMDEGLLTARFEFNLASPDYHHTVKGSLSPMNLEPLNKMIMKTAPLAVQSGSINRLDFDFTFNDKNANGEMFLSYNNLKIAVLDYSGDEIQKDLLSTLLANSLKVNTRHEGKNGLEPVTVNHERDEKRSIINYWWKSLYAGIAKVIEN